MTQRNIKLILEYDGTNYSGWQAQPDKSTIQGTLVEAILRLTGAEVKLTAASRTDSGVHARAQVANFYTDSALPVERIRSGLNALLPSDIAVKEAAQVAPEFDARRGSAGKHYVYTLINRPYRSAMLRDRAWYIEQPLDLAAMREAASHLVGKHDFTTFRASDSDSPGSVRELRSVEIEECGEGIVEIEVAGTAFLRHMVRIIVGTLVEVGRGRFSSHEMPAIIEARDRARAAKTAPARGLLLVEVLY